MEGLREYVVDDESPELLSDLRAAVKRYCGE
jgi:hypothetical protein